MRVFVKLEALEKLAVKLAVEIRVEGQIGVKDALARRLSRVKGIVGEEENVLANLRVCGILAVVENHAAVGNVNTRHKAQKR